MRFTAEEAYLMGCPIRCGRDSKLSKSDVHFYINPLISYTQCRKLSRRIQEID